MDIPLHVTTTDLDTMRRAVLIDPGDDLARLALADLCEEAGDVERACRVRHGLRRPGDVVKVWSDQYGGEMFVRRGLVEAVALSLAAFMEHAEALFRAHPITAVRLTDREPNDVSTAEGGVCGAWLRWDWAYMQTILIPGGTSTPYDVPHELLGDGPSKWLYFDTPELARAALSAACVAYGRALAGLPPLPGHPPADTGGHGGGSPVAGAVQPL